MTQTGQNQNTATSPFSAGLNDGLQGKPLNPASSTAAAPTTGGGIGGAISNTAGAIGNAAASGLNTVTNAVSHPGATVTSIEEKTKGFFDHMDIGKILGGILGLGGAWFLGSFFGSGIVSTILMIGLAFPLMIIGSDKLGGMINGWMGKKPEQQAGGPGVSSPSLAQSQAQGQSQAPAGVTLTQDEVNAMIEGQRQNGLATSQLTVTNKVTGQQTKINVAELQADFAQCLQNGYAPSVVLTMDNATGRVTPTACLPQQAAASNTPGRR